MEKFDKAVVDVFLEEANEILSRIEINLLDYEKKKSENLDKSLKRDFHTLKGNFFIYEKNEIGEYFHNLETRWEKPENITEDFITDILEQITFIKEELSLIFQENEKEDNNKTENPKQEKIKIVKAEERKTYKTYEVLIDFGNEEPGSIDMKSLEEDIFKSFESYDISYDFENIPKINELEPKNIYIKIKIIIKTENEVLISNILSKYINVKYYNISQVDERAKAEVKEVVKTEPKELDKKILVKEKNEIKKSDEKIPDEIKEANTIRVNTEKLDKLVNIIGELIVAHSSLKIFKDFVKKESLENYETTLTHLDSITKSMQEDILSIRMIPLENTFLQFKRVVRDISKKLNKNVELEIKGGETEIDKTIIEKIVDPLRHMVRNSIDHGIETPEERIKLGKSEKGYVRLSAYHQGGEVIIEVSDNGHGLDKERILQKAIEKRIISEDRILEDNEIYALIFEPGFSTAENVTELSGRGVGMDVVRTNIEELSGKIEIETKLGEYTIFKIRLPLTLAIIDGMLVKVGDNTYIVPLLAISETLQPKKDNLKKIKGKDEVVDIRGKYFPLVKLGNLFKIPNAIEDPTKATILLIDTYKGKMTLMVDEVIDTQQIVIKRLNLQNKEIEKFSGATILGTGEVALILDVKNIYDGIFKKQYSGGESFG